MLQNRSPAAKQRTLAAERRASSKRERRADRSANRSRSSGGTPSIPVTTTIGRGRATASMRSKPDGSPMASSRSARTARMPGSRAPSGPRRGAKGSTARLSLARGRLGGAVRRLSRTAARNRRPAAAGGMALHVDDGLPRCRLEPTRRRRARRRNRGGTFAPMLGQSGVGCPVERPGVWGRLRCATGPQRNAAAPERHGRSVPLRRIGATSAASRRRLPIDLHGKPISLHGCEARPAV